MIKINQVQYERIADCFPVHRGNIAYDNPGAVLTFELAGGRAAGAAFIDALTLFSNVANIGDVRSLAIHPATTTHSQLDDAALARAGVTPGTVRLSVGIEHIDDILADLERGLAAVAGA